MYYHIIIIYWTFWPDPDDDDRRQDYHIYHVLQKTRFSPGYGGNNLLVFAKNYAKEPCAAGILIASTLYLYIMYTRRKKDCSLYRYSSYTPRLIALYFRPKIVVNTNHNMFRFINYYYIAQDVR